jgi:hypothetical protein
VLAALVQNASILRVDMNDTESDEVLEHKTFPLYFVSRVAAMTVAKERRGQREWRHWRVGLKVIPFV